MRTILVVCGLGHEARIAAGQGIFVVAGGGVRSVLEGRLESLPPDDIAAVVSFGLAGALEPSLRVGDILVPDRISALDGETWPTSREFRKHWSGLGFSEHDPPRLQSNASFEALPRGAPQESRSTPAGSTALVGVDAPILGVADKSRLRTETGAAAIDMESHIAARYAARHALPFAALRVISDAADHALPAVAGAAMRPDGSVDVLGVLKGLARDPGQLPALLATARDAGRAFRALRRVRGLLGPGFGLQL